MKNCQVCGRTLRTGRKYCYACRGHQRGWSKYNVAFISIVGLVFLGYSWFTDDKFIDMLGFAGLIFNVPLFLLLIYYLIKRRSK